MACAGFILAAAENILGGAEYKSRGAKKFLPPCFYFAPPPPAEFDSAPGAEQTREGGAKNLCIQKALIQTFHTSF